MQSDQAATWQRNNIMELPLKYVTSELNQAVCPLPSAQGSGGDSLPACGIFRLNKRNVGKNSHSAMGPLQPVTHSKTRQTMNVK